uniref:Uncharacterized protein n=1 Tax=viral metagenome TaxID=1070528 RepID=A0A6C0EVY2_9ZZZZ
MDNNYVKEKIEQNKTYKQSLILKELKDIAPKISDDGLIQLYNKSISLHQSSNQKNGDFLENEILVKMLNYHDIKYKQQVTINNLGIIIGFNIKDKCYHIIDFVVGTNINVGESISLFKVISCKTTCRERWTQDDWSLTYIPQLFILLTLSNDYPSKLRFRESSKRKIITCTPKKKDDRIYKLNYDDLIKEL